jgi:hypothetical protein
MSRQLTTPVFRKISSNGLGDGLNSYAHAMAWFDNHLYVGITRANLCMIKANNPPPLRVWPTKCPDDVYDLDRRAQIWCFDPKAESWTRSFVSPLIKGRDGKRMARDVGYRTMAVFRGRTDHTSSLYVCSWSPARSEMPARIMRSANGIKFEEVQRPGKDATLNAYRALLPCKGRLYTSPGQTRNYHGNSNNSAVVLESANPGSNAWRPVSKLAFGDSDNVTLFEMAVFNNCLYVGTMNPAHGFQVWKSPLNGKPPYQWKKVLTNGAYRGRRNECALSFCVFNNALYVGSGIQNGGFDRTNKVGPAAAELLRIHPDDSWDLLVGEPRLTAYGLKLPLSGFGPGFDDFFNGYIWRMAAHDGWLYAGTFNWSVFLPYINLELWPDVLREPVKRRGVDEIVDERGGFDLWRSRDGVTWIPITLDGFGNHYNYGVRTLQSTPFGLFVGTANPFGPDVAVKTNGSWHYEPNPNGGTEIWVGTAEAPLVAVHKAL